MKKLLQLGQLLVLLCLVSTLSAQKTAVYFATASHQLDTKSKKILDEIVSQCEEIKSYSLDIKAYTDDRGSQSRNRALANRRASEVVSYLTKKGIVIDQRVVDAKGEIALTGKLSVSEERRQNRRVEIEITPFKPKSWDEFYSFFRKRNTQSFYIKNKRDTTIIARNGTILFIPANSLETTDGEALEDEFVKIDIYEAYQPKDMLLQNLTTTSDGEMLETGGMVHLQANRVSDGKEIQMKEESELTLSMPSSNELPKDMRLFTADRTLDNTEANINWKTDGEKKFAKPDMLKLFDASEDFFTSRLSIPIKYPKDLNLPSINRKIIENPPYAPTLGNAPKMNAEAPSDLVDFESFMQENPRRKKTASRRKESKRKYKKRVASAYKQAQRKYVLDSTKYERKLAEYKAAMERYEDRVKSFPEEYAEYEAEKKIYDAECEKIRLWMMLNNDSIRAWSANVEYISSLFVDGRSVKEYMIAIARFQRIRDQLLQEAQIAGLTDLVDTLNSFNLHVKEAKQAAVQLHLATKNSKIGLPRLTTTDANNIRNFNLDFRFEIEFSNPKLVDAASLLEIYDVFSEIHKNFRKINNLADKFSAFQSDSAFVQIRSQLDILKHVNERFAAINDMRNREYYLLIWEEEYYDALSTADKNRYDRLGFFQKEDFMRAHIKKMVEEARRKRLASLEQLHLSNLSNSEKEEYANLGLEGKEAFLESYMLQRFNRIKNIVNVTNFGWINCDAFRRYNMQKIACEPLAQLDENAKMYILYHDLEMVLPYKLRSDVDSYIFGVPPKEKGNISVVVVRIEMEGGTVFASRTQGVGLEMDGKELNPLQAVSAAELTAMMQ